MAYGGVMAPDTSRDVDVLASALAVGQARGRRPLAVIDRGGRCVVRGEHEPVWGRADTADLVDHPRGARYAAEVAYGLTVWVTRCAACVAPLLILGKWGTGRTAPPTADSSLVFELDGAELAPEELVALNRAQP